MNLEMVNLFNRVDELERRVAQLEANQIDPYKIVSFTAVAVTGQMNLKPLQMAPNAYLGPSTQVAMQSVPDFDRNVAALEGVAKRCGLVKEPKPLFP